MNATNLLKSTICVIFCIYILKGHARAECETETWNCKDVISPNMSQTVGYLRNAWGISIVIVE